MSAELSNGSAVEYHFGSFRFDARLCRLYREGEPVALTPKAADTLLALLQRPGRVIEKDELLQAVWGDTFVGDDTLAQNISTLRRALADEANRPQFIATIPRRGYKFVAPVRVASTAQPTSAPQPAASQPRRYSVTMPRLAALLGATAAVAAFATFAVGKLSVKEERRPSVQFTIDVPEGHRFSTSGGVMAISPDGKHLAVVITNTNGSSSLWLRPLESPVFRSLDNTDGAIQPFWSPDSKTIGFYSDRRLKAVAVESGAVRVVATIPRARFLGGTWNRDGQILFSVPEDGLYVVSASGGAPQRLTLAVDKVCRGCVAWPSFLPDGRRFLYTVIRSDASLAGVYVGELGKPGGSRLLDAVSSATYVAPGFLMYARSGTLYAHRFDEARTRLIGTPLTVSDDVAQNASTGRVLATVSDAGVLAYRRRFMTELVWMDRAGRPQQVAAPAATYLNFCVAPDGRRVAAARIDPGSGTSDVWIFDEGREIRVTSNADWDNDPVWVQEGTHVLYSARRGNQWGIYRRQATAIGPEESLVKANGAVIPLQVLPSAQMVYAASRATPPYDLWKLSEGRSTPVAQIGGYYPSDAQLSPDEKWLAYGIPEGGVGAWTKTIYVSAAPFGENRRAIAAGASSPRWRADGRELFYLSSDSSLMAVPIDPQRTPSDGEGRALFDAPTLTMTGVTGNTYDVTPDGQRFLVKREVGSSPVHVMLNWNAPSAF